MASSTACLGTCFLAHFSPTCLTTSGSYRATVHTARYLCAQHSPLRRTGSLSTGAEGVLKVGVEDSTGLRPYSKYQYAAAQTTEYSSRAQHRPRRGLKVRVGLSTGHRFCTATRIAPADARSCTNIALRRLQGVVQPAHLQHSGCRSMTCC